MPRWPADLLVPSLRGLCCYGNRDEWHHLGVGAAELPNLEFLIAGVDAEGQALSTIAEFDRLRFLRLNGIYDVDALFDAPAAGLEHLQLRFSGSALSIAGLPRLSALRSLSLLHIDAEIDCRCIAALPLLEELELVGTPRLAHVGALRECPRLERVESTEPLSSVFDG